MIDTDLLHSLAPTDLPIHRELRYDGGGFGVPLAQFVPEDQALLRTLYDGVKGFHDAWLRTRPAPDEDRLLTHLRQFSTGEFLTAAQRLGQATEARAAAPPMVRKVVHDVRGGGLTVLIGTASLLQMGIKTGPTLQTCIHVARDHAKIMRNAVVDIDPPTRAADESAKAHGITHFVEKWTGAEIRIDDRAAAVTVRCDYRGDISARCLETSAIDRILYNYVNNAVRFAADGRVDLTIFTVGPSLVRWVVSNTMTAEQRAWLTVNVGPDLKRLFRGGLTHGGQGIGLTNCADFLAASFGLSSATDAIDQEYLGAKVVDDHYHAWFHWPAYIPGGGDGQTN